MEIMRTINKTFITVMLAMALVFGMIGCAQDSESGGGGGGSYTFEFKVENSDVNVLGNMIKIEFINGANNEDQVLETKIVNIAPGEMTSAYRVSGFTQKNSDDVHIFGVKVTYDNEDYYFNNKDYHFSWGASKNNGKIRVYGTYVGLSFSDGNW
jgi:hypothetical protein